MSSSHNMYMIYMTWIVVLLQAWHISSFQSRLLTKSTFFPTTATTTAATATGTITGLPTVVVGSSYRPSSTTSTKWSPLTHPSSSTSSLIRVESSTTALFAKASRLQYRFNLDERLLPTYGISTTTMTFMIIACTFLCSVLGDKLYALGISRNIRSVLKASLELMLSAYEGSLAVLLSYGRGLKSFFIDTVLRKTKEQVSAGAELVRIGVAQRRVKPQTTSTVSNTAWMKCKLDKRTAINDRYSLLRFKATSDIVAPLNNMVGKKVVLCVSENGTLRKRSFYPLTSPHYKAQFEIVVSNDTYYDDVEDEDSFDNLLLSLDQSEEIAFKLGTSTFRYQGSESIKYLTLIASGKGIVALLPLLRRVLSSQKEFQVDSCELMWINHDKDDFILDEEIEELEEMYPDQFSCARVLDAGVLDVRRMLNEKVRDALPGYEPGRVAIIASGDVEEDHEVIDSKFEQALHYLDYPEENVMIV